MDVFGFVMKSVTCNLWRACELGFQVSVSCIKGSGGFVRTYNVRAKFKICASQTTWL